MDYLITYELSLRLLTVIGPAGSLGSMAPAAAGALSRSAPGVSCIVLPPAQARALAARVRPWVRELELSEKQPLLTASLALDSALCLTALAEQGQLTLLVNTQPLVIGARNVPAFLDALEQAIARGLAVGGDVWAGALGIGFAIERALVLTARAACGGGALERLDAACERFRGCLVDFDVVGADRLLPSPAHEPPWLDYRHPHPKSLLGQTMVLAFAPPDSRGLARYSGMLHGQAEADLRWQTEVLQPFMSRYAFRPRQADPAPSERSAGAPPAREAAV